MSIKKIVPCLDIKDGKLTKGIKFQNNIALGDPLEAALNYENDGADELIIYDFSASSEERFLDFPTIKLIVDALKISVTIGGGLNSLQAIEKVLSIGAAKVSLNSAVVANPKLLDEAAKEFGEKHIVLGLDALKTAEDLYPSSYKVMTKGASFDAKMDVVAWAQEAVSRGAGEICLNSIDADGVREGYELNITRRVAEKVKVPVTASGGAGKPEHLYQVLTEGLATAALVASMVHYDDYTIRELKDYLVSKGLDLL